MSLEEETEDTYVALKQACGAGCSKFPVCTVEHYAGSVNAEGNYNGVGFISSCMEFQYTGDLKDGQLHGNGHLAWSNGYKIDGAFAEGIANGKGRITWPNGDTYEGDIVNGVRHGAGVLTSHNGKAVYDGWWYRSRRHGKGSQSYTDGSVYSGDWHHDTRHGRGVMTYANNDAYEGDWKEDKREGSGSMGWRHSTKHFVELYDGEWSDGKPHGRGVSTYVRPLDDSPEDSTSPVSYAPPVASVINTYRGYFVNGVRHGLGTFYYADGSAYEGDWLNGKKNGNGLFVNYNGSNFFGKFLNDVPQNLPQLVELGNAGLVPEVCTKDIFSLSDGSQEQLSTTIKSLLLRFNTPLRAMFSAYANKSDDIAFVFTQQNWWKHRRPSRISVPQFLRLLSDKEVLRGLVSIGTVIQCVVQVIEREFGDYSKERTGHLPVEETAESVKAKIYRSMGSLNYRQFAETIVRLSPQVSCGPRFSALGEKFNALVVEKLMVNDSVRPLCQYSRTHLTAITPFLPRLELKFNALVDLDMNARYRMLKVRDFFQFIHTLLDEYGISYANAVEELLPIDECDDITELPPGYNQPQSELSLSIFTEGCGPNKEDLINVVSMERIMTVVDFVEAVVMLAVKLEKKNANRCLEEFLEEILCLPV